MKVIDVIFALVCGRMVGFLLGDFLHAWGIELAWYYQLLVWLFFPFFTLFCLWVAHAIGRKWLFVFQAAKHALVGAVATIIDLKLFEGLVWLAAMAITINPIIAKGLSFLVATALKYWGNKYWAFQKHEQENMYHEAGKFFGVTLFGLLIDVAAFYYFTSISGPLFGIPEAAWLKLSVIFAGLAAAIFNFVGYKFFVFKK